MTRIIVAGSRDFTDYSRLCSRLDEIIADIHDEIEIVSGHARGADSLGERYARENGLKIAVFPANWDLYGKSAGVIRNQQMLDYASKETPLVVAFWDGCSRGTLDMIKRARKAEIKTLIY